MKRITRYLLVCLSLLFASFLWAFDTKTKSPDGKIRLEFTVKKGVPYYHVFYSNREVIKPSVMGIVTSESDFSKGLSISLALHSKVTDEYTLENSKKKNSFYQANKLIIKLKKRDSQSVLIVFQVSNDGVAYSYKLKGKGDVKILSETSSFAFPEKTLVYMTPLSKAKSGWARTNPSYEEFYQIKKPIETPSDFGQGWVYPALFEVGQDWILISETGVDRNYLGTHLADDSKGGVYKIEFPHPDHNLPKDPTSASVSLPYQTPWRTLNIGSLKSIVESTLAQDLVKPLYKEKYDFKPGRAAWNWIIQKDNQVTYENQIKYIDMAQKLGWEYVLIDAPWDVNIGRKKIEKLASYANERGVSLLLWYNSNGNWNDAPQTPKDCMNTPEARAKEMKWMQSIGIKGIKVDFFGGDKQVSMELYDAILRDANNYNLTVNFHGTTLPRGWERMYPNFVTSEAVKGMEFCTFEQNVADRAPMHCVHNAFVRNVVGSMDFTPLALNARLGNRYTNGPVRRTTVAFELALPVVFFSVVQHFAIVPENLDQFPEFVWSYLKKVPTTWSETLFIDGDPKTHIVLARRSKSTWYVAGINGQKEVVKTLLDLSFAKGKTAKLITDADVWNQVKQEQVIIPNNGSYAIDIPAQGGFILIIE